MHDLTSVQRVGGLIVGVLNGPTAGDLDRCVNGFGGKGLRFIVADSVSLLLENETDLSTLAKGDISHYQRLLPPTLSCSLSVIEITMMNSCTKLPAGGYVLGAMRGKFPPDDITFHIIFVDVRRAMSSYDPDASGVMGSLFLTYGGG